MAIVRIPDKNKILCDAKEITSYLKSVGLAYEIWQPAHQVASDTLPEAILDAYRAEIDQLKRRGGYVTADIIDVKPQTENLETMLAKFDREHWHDEDEVRFTIEGRGLFFVRPRKSPVLSVEVIPGDLLSVPAGTWHWFYLGPEQRIRTIRLFQDPSGWIAHYTDSGMEKKYPPVWTP